MNAIAVVRSICPQNPILSIAATIAFAQFSLNLSVSELHFVAELADRSPMSTDTTKMKRKIINEEIHAQNKSGKRKKGKKSIPKWIWWPIYCIQSRHVCRHDHV